MCLAPAHICYTVTFPSTVLHHQAEVLSRIRFYQNGMNGNISKLVFPKSLGLVRLDVFSAALTLMDCFSWMLPKR